MSIRDWGSVRLVAALLAALALVAGCGGAGAPPAAPAPARPPATGAPPAGMPKAEPESIDIPRIGAHSTLVGLGLNADNTVQVPPVTEPMQAGWYTYGPTPGEVGPAVVLGHVDGNKQKGIFFRLHELVPGDEVTISRKDGTVARFVVDRVDQVAKKEFPTDAVYGDTDAPELRLITCGGSFDRDARSYRDNVIVYAKLT
ncbi:class F sortase [Amycolatopsis suaedae]|uniref:Class F sortase n=1 Tax=Amycolatopsis suaedae TaxID=2510978 RepID=A0A4Q7J7J9_9PSEU|nr:class F sortase [Amycolatopsis suaedae]RZQ62772.1 class F sortase [Amycolatopsis suaedae]